MGRMLGCCPKHQVRMLVPDRGDPTTKIGEACLFIFVAAHPESIQRFDPLAHDSELWSDYIVQLAMIACSNDSRIHLLFVKYQSIHERHLAVNHRDRKVLYNTYTCNHLLCRLSS